jgi:hypothetical protein
MATLRELFASRLTGLESAFADEKAKLESDLAEVGPLAEHDVQSLLSWMQAALKHIGTGSTPTS